MKALCSYQISLSMFDKLYGCCFLLMRPYSLCLKRNTECGNSLGFLEAPMALLLLTIRCNPITVLEASLDDRCLDGVLSPHCSAVSFRLSSYMHIWHNAMSEFFSFYLSFKRFCIIIFIIYTHFIIYITYIYIILMIQRKFCK